MTNLSRPRRESPTSSRSRRLATIAAIGTMTAVSTLTLGLAGSASADPAAGPAPAPRSVSFQPIREVFDGNRVARIRDTYKACKGDLDSTEAMVTCNDDKTENIDVKVDIARQAAFSRAKTEAARTAINVDDAAWLSDRLPICDAAYPSSGGGSIVKVLVSSGQRAVSQARLDAVLGHSIPTSQLVATDDINPDATEYATTGRSTRVGAIDTQGDQTGGVIIAWVIVGGYKGFTVTPGSFTYVDGSFTDKGIVEGHPSGHQVAAGTEYVFDIDYSNLAHDPNGAKGKGRFEYHIGSDLVGAWK